MTQQHPKDTLQADLEALAEVFEAEDREDRRGDAQRRRNDQPCSTTRTARRRRPSGVKGALA
ncbi:hypothetical protein [Propionibacterium freudenreichii]|uniref:hypothetical protein n=1 Tax=Propionibacterium freudenreichii TaxID=1744 RepID=UPI00254E0FD9|nr:hypothetical protein [Propionibacterium freudenreichii]MDK9654696.1 hypothetical protein [Propionibacterium freudenreichii]